MGEVPGLQSKGAGITEPADNNGVPPPVSFRTQLLRTVTQAALIVAISFLIAAILLPWLPFNRTRDGPGSGRLWCSSNLRQIGLALKMYANEFDDQFPPSFKELLLHEEITADVFCCPSTETDRAVGPTTQAIADQLVDPGGKHCSYYYAGNGLSNKTIKDDDILAFEPASNHSGQGCNVLFGDGHVDWYDATGAAKRSYDKLLTDFRAGVRPLRWSASP